VIAECLARLSSGPVLSALRTAHGADTDGLAVFTTASLRHGARLIEHLLCNDLRTAELVDEFARRCFVETPDWGSIFDLRSEDPGVHEFLYRKATASGPIPPDALAVPKDADWYRDAPDGVFDILCHFPSRVESCVLRAAFMTGHTRLADAMLAHDPATTHAVADAIARLPWWSAPHVVVREASRLDGEFTDGFFRGGGDDDDDDDIDDLPVPLPDDAADTTGLHEGGLKTLIWLCKHGHAPPAFNAAERLDILQTQLCRVAADLEEDDAKVLVGLFRGCSGRLIAELLGPTFIANRRTAAAAVLVRRMGVSAADLA
jgi:hypothetical protein